MLTYMTDMLLQKLNDNRSFILQFYFFLKTLTDNELLGSSNISLLNMPSLEPPPPGP